MSSGTRNFLLAVLIAALGTALGGLALRGWGSGGTSSPAAPTSATTGLVQQSTTTTALAPPVAAPPSSTYLAELDPRAYLPHTAGDDWP